MAHRYVLKTVQDGGTGMHEEFVYEMSNSDFSDFIRKQMITV